MHAKKRLGQNFLVDERIVERIIREVGPRADETIIEIGPGRGALTSRLIEKAGGLIAIEFDHELVPLLSERFTGTRNFRLVEDDALATDLCSLLAIGETARVVANLPYYISTAILQRLIEQRRCISEMVLMLQREVVERITAPPAESERGYLTVLVEAYCETERLFDVAPTSFRPVPQVWSTVLRLKMSPRIHVKDEELLWRIVGAGFAQKRKTIFNNLRNAPAGLREQIELAGGTALALETAEIAPRRRAETLLLKEWMKLASVIEHATEDY